MRRLSTTIVAVGVMLAIVSAACELFSVAAFYGLGAEAWPICGSACEVWPGIPTGAACILICVLRNGAYIPLFYSGLATGCTASGVVIAGLASERCAAIVPAPAPQ
jgi:hypothetical protein